MRTRYKVVYHFEMRAIAHLQVLGIMWDQSTLSKIENQQRPVTDMELVALAKALKVSTAWLLNDNS
jgi:HTH-type transcriptional regulator, cell division transcriptional repressor